MTLSSNQRPVAFRQVIDALLDMQQPFPAKFLHRFSDIIPEDLKQLKEIWTQVDPDRRSALLEDLELVMEADTLVSYDELAKFTLFDTDPRVRAGSIRLLWESEDHRLVPTLIQYMNEDEDVLVRATAANALGQFVYLGELEEIPAILLQTAVENLLAMASSQEPDSIRRRALESLGFSSRPEVMDLVRESYESEDPEWLASALFAMGRSANEDWEPEVLEMIDHPESDVQIEAVRAAGNLELDNARVVLLDMLEDGIENDDLRAAVIWSLSQIGGENVQETLSELLDATEDDDEIEIIEEALDNLTFTEGFDRFAMLDLADQDGTEKSKTSPGSFDEDDDETEWDDHTPE